MNLFPKSLAVVGQVFGLILGSNYHLPVNETMERHWTFRSYA
jgi:hypothetical protein